ncbi:hypothetical protein [Streptomyces sp. NBC_01187]|uniref:hypothetical protein n=1 Tax=Streptomyces sp. NBC_01187 TaxID=2903766 RepID=UPI00386BB72A|nr:hypothetical protein OG220_19835 [Streptomyces sp. NBC_01187]
MRHRRRREQQQYERRGRSGRAWTGRAGAVVAALCAVAVISPAPGAAALAKPKPYEISGDARKTAGASSSADAPQIKPGLFHDRIGPGQEKYYAVNLDAKSSMHVTATAVPTPGTKVTYEDGLKLTLQNTNGDSCGTMDLSAGGDTAYPLTASAARLIGDENSESCREKGPYLVRLERDEGSGSGPGSWPVELSLKKEPGLKGSIPAPYPGTEDETDDNNKRPTPPSGTAKSAKGGTGFNDARALDSGVWKDRLQPGETRYYRVPVDWGQRLYARTEVPNSPAEEGTISSTYISKGFRMNVYNPARDALYDENFQSYDGDGAKFDRYSNPVRYENRFADEASGTRFAGWYYIAVTAGPEMAEPFPKGTPVTVRVAVKGKAKKGPAYDGDAVAAGFGVSDTDREMAEKGLTAAEVEHNDTLRTVGYTGIGAGAALILVLAVWMLLARHRAAAPAPVTAPGPWPTQHQQPEQYQQPQQYQQPPTQQYGGPGGYGHHPQG